MGGVVSSLGAYDLGGAWERVRNAESRKIRNVSVFIGHEFSPESAKLLVKTLKVFPAPALQRFAAGRIFRSVSAQEYENISTGKNQAFSPQMGIKIVGSFWYIREDILVSRSFAAKVWYAASSLIAGDLKDEPGFDRSRFQAEFNRYLIKRIGSPLVEPWAAAGFHLAGVDLLYQTFLDELVETEDYSSGNLRKIFADSKAQVENVRQPVVSKKKILLARRNPWLFVRESRRMYEQLKAEEGVNWTLGSDDVLNLSLQNEKYRERPNSSHRLNLHYYNEEINSWVGSNLTYLVRGNDVEALFAPGFVAAYETSTATSGRKVSVLAGLLMEAGLGDEDSKWKTHAYFGVPLLVDVKTFFDDNDENGFLGYPQMEFGLQRTNSYFIGAMLTLPSGKEELPYAGLTFHTEI